MPAGNGLWLIYALGGGWGHLTRAAALALAAKPGHRAQILTNSPYARHVAKSMPELDLIVLDPALDPAVTRSSVVQHIRKLDPSCLIVDTFPRGLGGELAQSIESFAATKVLVHRDLTPVYIAEASLRQFVESHYDLIVIPGEDETDAFAGLPAARITAPWLVPARQNIVQSARPTVLIVASGNAEELAWYGAVVAQLRAIDPTISVLCVAPSCPPGCPEDNWIEHWPAVDLIANARTVVGGAGYNTVWQCLCCQIPLIARPWPRQYDRQWLRATRASQSGQVIIVREAHEAASAVVDLLKREATPAPRLQERNGAAEAVMLIEREIAK